MDENAYFTLISLLCVWHMYCVCVLLSMRFASSLILQTHKQKWRFWRRLFTSKLSPTSLWNCEFHRPNRAFPGRITLHVSSFMQSSLYSHRRGKRATEAHNAMFSPCRHMKEISELQALQRGEIEQLYSRLGRPVPPSVGFLHAVPPSGRRRRASKHKLKGSRLLNPMVQQLRSNRSNSSSMYAGVCVCRSTSFRWSKGWAHYILAPIVNKMLFWIKNNLHLM